MNHPKASTISEADKLALAGTPTGSSSSTNAPALIATGLSPTGIIPMNMTTGASARIAPSSCG